jgi:hypothetical protein
MTFPHVFDRAAVSPSPQRMRNPNALLRGKRKILARIPAVGFAKTTALFNDPFHDAILS